MPFEKRISEARRILARYPGRIPVIVEKAPRSDIPEIQKNKFLVPGTMLMGEFKYVVHKHVCNARNIAMTAEQAIYLFVHGTIPKTGAHMSEVYGRYKAEDQFLYITYGAENTLGEDVRSRSSNYTTSEPTSCPCASCHVGLCLDIHD